MAETRTEYAVKSTSVRHGRWQTLIESCPGQETDRATHERTAERIRDWQANSGRTPDAVLVSRTVTVGEWEEV